MESEGSDGRVGDDEQTDRYRHLIEHVQDAVVEFELVDQEPIVVSVNRSFVDVFGYDADAIRGQPLNEWVVPDWKIAEARGLDANTSSGEINYQEVTRETANGLREFLYRGIPYEDGVGSGGFAVYTDLTEIARNERRLKVLNRILRHNLRNNANIVAGHTTRLLAEFDEPDAATIESAATVERAARELERLAEEAGHIRRILQRTTDETVDIDVGTVVRTVVDEHRRRSPNAVIDVTVDDGETVLADDRLRYAIDGLVDNAIEHNPSEAPRVHVRLDDPTDEPDATAAEWAVLHVEDDGPRIPLNERDVIQDDEAISPTYHGSGLGLWLTELTVEAFGGELSFGVSDDLGGNDVSIRLRRP
ncbi:ATP-binding protein [Halorubrum sp. HHNYT27]|uniref:ATP-binding protein n=1 Tax=Halorubrum sp. HHNYT27 TaxID=3402275 RepID=UPI003EC05A90